MQCGRNVSRGGGQALESHMGALLSLNNSIRVQWGENLMCLTKRKTTGPQLCMQLELISAMRFKKNLKKWLYRVLVCMFKRTLQHQSQRYIKIGGLKVLWISLTQRADIKLVAYLHFCKWLSDQVFRNGHDVTDVIVNILNSWLPGFCSVAPSGNVDPSVQLFPQ